MLYTSNQIDVCLSVCSLRRSLFDLEPHFTRTTKRLAKIVFVPNLDILLQEKEYSYECSYEKYVQLEFFPNSCHFLILVVTMSCK